MKLANDRQSTLAHTFHMEALVDTKEQFERAMSLAFNDQTAHYIAATRYFGLIFLEGIESEMENKALNHLVEFDVEPHDMSGKKAARESYNILALESSGLSTGPAIEYTLDWLERLSDDQFHYIAGPKREAWDMANFPGVKVSTGYALAGHIGMHGHAICYVKPIWLVSNRNF